MWGIDPETGEVWEDDPAFTGVVTTLDNSDGYTTPDDVIAVMRDTFRAEAKMGNSPVLNQRAGEILMDWVDENIVVGSTPE